MSGMFSTKGRYAMRVMADLAVHDGWVSLGDISKRQGISRKYLEQVVSQLTKVGFVESARGKGGGYRLSRPAEDYSLGDILRVAEGGTLAPVACLDCASAELCPRMDDCPTLPIWQELGQVTSAFLDSKSLADIIQTEGDGLSEPCQEPRVAVGSRAK